MAKSENLKNFYQEYRASFGVSFPTSRAVFFGLSGIGEELGWKPSSMGLNRGIAFLPEGYRIDWNYEGADLSARALVEMEMLIISALNYVEDLPNWSRISEVTDRHINLLLP